MSVLLPSERENRIYQARLYCEQARIVLSPVTRGLPHHLLEMTIVELRSEEARLKAGDGLMEPRPRRREGQATAEVATASSNDDDHLGRAR